MQMTKNLPQKCFTALLLTLVFLLGTPLSASANTLNEGEYYTLTVIHTNDIHGHLDKLPKYATIIKQVRAESKNVLVLDAGDIFLRGEFESQLGQVELDMLNAMGYDAWVLGNNDFRVPGGGTTIQGNDQLQAMVSKANFPVLTANATMKATGSYIDNVSPYIIKNVGGVDVAIIGVTSMKPQARGWQEVADKVFIDGDETVKAILPAVSEKSDINIVLSHTGLANDLKTANIKGVSAVIGADDHYLLAEPMYNTYKGMKNTPITQGGGEENHHIGRLNLVFQKQGGEMKMVNFEGYLYNLDLVKADQGVQDILDAHRRAAQAKPAA